LHPLSDDRRILPIERTGETLQAPPDFMLVVSYNPGYQNLFKGMKPSTRQRFVSLRFNYPRASQEVMIVQQESGVAEHLAKQLVSLARAMRALKDHDLEESVSTRLLVYTASMIKSGFSPSQSCLAAMVEPLSDDEDTVAALMEVVYATFGE